MFKKIEIWILYLFFVLVFISYMLFGSMVIREAQGPSRYIPLISEISKSLFFIAEIPLNIKRAFQDLDVHKIKENRFENISGFYGTPNNKEYYLLLTRYDGDIRQYVVELISLIDFKVLHTWNPGFDEIWKLVDVQNDLQWKNLIKDKVDKRSTIGHPIIEEDGSIIFSSESPFLKINKNNELEWIKDDENYHHSLERDFEGNYWVCVRYLPYKISTISLNTGNRPE